jgi:hypothetical protein
MKTINTTVADANIHLTHDMASHISRNNTQETITPCHIKLAVMNHKKYTSKQLRRQVITPARLHIPLFLAWHKRPSRFSGVRILSYRHLVEILGRDIRPLQSLYLHSQHKHTSDADTQSRNLTHDLRSRLRA